MDRKDFDLSIDIIAAIRDTVGDSVDILVEGHSRFTVDEAVQIARRLEPLQPMWFEEPVRHDRVTAVAEVARRSPVPIATGESFHTLGEFAELGAAGGVAYWQPEAAHLGGLTGLRAVANLAEAHDTVLAPHQAGGPVATAVCLTLAGCVNNHVIQEFFDPFNATWGEALVDWEPQLDSDGCLPIPMRPGIGLELNMDVADSRPYSEENFLAIFQDSWEKRRSG
jgi:galactonate dehydratase